MASALRSSSSATVSDVHLVTDRETGRSRGFAFVTMGTTEEAAKAIEGMDGKTLDGRPLRVNEAEQRQQRGGGGGGGGGGFRGGGGGGGGYRGGGGGGVTAVVAVAVAAVAAVGAAAVAMVVVVAVAVVAVVAAAAAAIAGRAAPLTDELEALAFITAL